MEEKESLKLTIKLVEERQALMMNDLLLDELSLIINFNFFNII